jgi:hypothetical protein
VHYTHNNRQETLDVTNIYCIYTLFNVVKSNKKQVQRLKCRVEVLDPAILQGVLPLLVLALAAGMFIYSIVYYPYCYYCVLPMVIHCILYTACHVLLHIVNGNVLQALYCMFCKVL